MFILCIIGGLKGRGSSLQTYNRSLMCVCVCVCSRLCENTQEVFTITLSLWIVSYFSFYLDLERQGRREEDKIKKESKGTSTEIPLVDIITTGKVIFSNRSALQRHKWGFIKGCIRAYNAALGSTLGYFHTLGEFHKAVAWKKFIMWA